mmetsp:Transcript_14046/g.41217  ORF Transcript_14046/g.41217 Transcript_14046/m.41217 type:complete len:291 (-) Transcript_14046:17-889(-)
MGDSHESPAPHETLLEREEQARPTSSHPARAACAPRQPQSLLDHFPILHQPATQKFTTKTCPPPTHSPSTRPTEALAEPSAQSAARSPLTPHQPNQLPATQHTTKDCPQSPGPCELPNQDKLSTLYTASHAPRQPTKRHAPSLTHAATPPPSQAQPHPSHTRHHRTHLTIRPKRREVTPGARLSALLRAKLVSNPKSSTADLTASPHVTLCLMHLCNRALLRRHRTCPSNEAPSRDCREEAARRILEGVKPLMRGLDRCSQRKSVFLSCPSRHFDRTPRHMLCRTNNGAR